MSSLPPIGIEAVVDDAERATLAAAARQLGECLSTTVQDRVAIRLNFAPSLAAIDVSAPKTIVIASLLPEVSGSEPMASTQLRWQRQIASLPVSTAVAVFLCTVFRHVPRNASGQGPDERTTIVERIRRLNLLAAELSHDTGAAVIDIDRAFAHVGARALDTDYRLSGAEAAEFAGHTIAASILSIGLDDAVAPEVQERAMQFQDARWRGRGRSSRGQRS